MSEPARPPLPLEREVHLCEAQSTNEQLKGVFTTIQNFVSRFRRRSTHFDTSDEHLVYRQWCPTTEPRVGLEEPTMGTVAAKFQRCLTHSRLFKTFTLVSSTAIFGGAVSDHTERKQYCFLSGPFCSQTRPAHPHMSLSTAAPYIGQASSPFSIYLPRALSYRSITTPVIGLRSPLIPSLRMVLLKCDCDGVLV